MDSDRSAIADRLRRIADELDPERTRPPKGSSYRGSPLTPARARLLGRQLSEILRAISSS